MKAWWQRNADGWKDIGLLFVLLVLLFTVLFVQLVVIAMARL